MLFTQEAPPPRFSLIESHGEVERERGRERSKRADGEGQPGRLELVTRGRRGRGISATRGIRGVSSISGIFSVDSPVGKGTGEVRRKSLEFVSAMHAASDGAPAGGLGQ